MFYFGSKQQSTVWERCIDLISNDVLILVACRSHMVEEKATGRTQILTEVVINFGGMTSQFHELNAIVNKPEKIILRATQ